MFQNSFSDCSLQMSAGSLFFSSSPVVLYATEAFAVWRRKGRFDTSGFKTIGVVIGLGDRIAWSRRPEAKLLGRGTDGAIETTDSPSSGCSSGMGGMPTRLRSLVASVTQGCARRHVGYSGSPAPIRAWSASRSASMVSMRCSWVCQSNRLKLSTGCIHEAQMSDKSIKSLRREANLSISSGSSSCPNCLKHIASGRVCTRWRYARMCSRESDDFDSETGRRCGGAWDVHSMSRESLRGDRPEYARAYFWCQRRIDVTLHS